MRPDDDGVADDPRRIVVASVPANHVYVRHLSAEAGSRAIRLPDPDPEGGTAAATQKWWPPVMLEPSWVESHDFDVFHLHFGFDARSVADLEALVASLRERGRPFVFTVHDLRNPHHVDRELHDQQLDVLVPAADRLITLTQGAAEEIKRRWGREALVLPHPHVVPFETMRAANGAESVRHSGGRRSGFRVGLHVKSLRAGMHPHPLVPTLVETLRELPGAVLQVDGHREVLEDGGARYDAELAGLLQEYADRGLLDLRVHDYFTDDELWRYLSSIDVSVLPYRFGTHSGWLEACRDLGTAVIAPTCGYFADQAPVLSYQHDESGFDPESLVRAVRAAYDGHAVAATSIEERRHQRTVVGSMHDRLYADLVRTSA
ncbi:glycosyltransferase [Nocardioides sp.]|uniref:glycosyltransferase n=1 Tax=Nocardioides sp. TaxID=35761 RepID=UPI002C40CD08|nr:glycosyltransferase [Nocardioides sp.]HXH79098.1 glycosyltransferase [Nocardioides sp.]